MRTAVGGEPIALLEQVVEAPHALEPGGRGHLAYRKVRVGEQALRQKEAAGLQVLHRRHLELALEGPSQVAVGVAQPLRHALEALAARAALAQQRGRPPREVRGRVGDGVAGRELRAAHEARAVSGSLRLGRCLVERAVLVLRHVHVADGAAVHARGGHAHERLAVESRIFRRERRVQRPLARFRMVEVLPQGALLCFCHGVPPSFRVIRTARGGAAAEPPLKSPYHAAPRRQLRHRTASPTRV